MMEIILMERIDKLGQMGDVVNVKDGYARNYLLPQKKALRATEANLERFAQERVQLEAARKAYGRVANGKRPAQALMEDRKVHRDLRKTAESLRQASEQLRGRRRKRRWGRWLVIGLIGAGLAIALNEELRKTVLDWLFGAEEEFEYTSTTAPAEEEEETAAAAGAN